MKVAFADGGLNSTQGLRLVIPTGSTVARAAGCDDLGMSHVILISAPFIAVIPAGAQLATVVDNDPTGWVIALKPGVLGQVSQEAFDDLVVGCELAVAKNLHGAAAQSRKIARLVYDAHAAPADRSKQLVLLRDDFSVEVLLHARSVCQLSCAP